MALRRLALAAIALVTLTGCGIPGVRQYEYDERVDLSLDGSAIVDVNASILPSSRFVVWSRCRSGGAARPRSYSTPVSGAGIDDPALSSFRRHGRRFVHVQVEVSDIHQLSKSAPSPGRATASIVRSRRTDSSGRRPGGGKGCRRRRMARRRARGVSHPPAEPHSSSTTRPRPLSAETFSSGSRR